MSAAIGGVVMARLASLHELDTVYGSEDLADLIEMLSVERHNEQAMIEWSRAKR